ncbi:outer membrane lipoprotein chaperone LolA [Psychromonas sp. MME2]|uniref:outer membrane lipoprotein chaperone LolA n=1 Tax=unclassified Psychromonas TaxID=2614957 RepID=UPI00339D1C4D
MKKVMAILCGLLILPNFVLATELTDAMLLKQKLERFTQLEADFTQLVSSDEGKVLNKSAGELVILRPGKFRWHVATPEEELIVANGQTMWIYSPFIEQVTLINLRDAMEGTPFILLSGANEQQWADYKVVKEGDIFTVTSLDTKAQGHTFIFEFSANDSISKFIVVEAQGQRSTFTLTYKQPLTKIAPDFFEFKIPAGVEIDDQR